MKNMKNENGFAVAMVLLFFSVMFVGFVALASLGASQARAASQSIQNIKTLYLAEAAVQQGMAAIQDYFYAGTYANEDVTTSFGDGEREFTVETVLNEPLQRIVTGKGGVPSLNPATDRTKHAISNQLQR